MVSLLEDRIVQTKLTKTGYKVAEYLLQNESQLCFMTALSVANEIGVSDASVIRVTRALGFDGFSDMQKQLREKASNMLQGSNSADFAAPVELLESKAFQEDHRGDVLIKECLNTAMQSIYHVAEHNDISKFEEAVSIITTSQKKVIAGFRSSSSVANYFSLMLSLMQPEVYGITQGDSDAIDRMMYLTPRDCVILFSFPRYFKMSKGIAEMAKDKGAKLIILTDSVTSPIANGADVVISARSGRMSIFSSNMAAQFAAELLITMLYKEAGDKNKEVLKWKEKFSQKYGVFCSSSVSVV